MKKCFIAIVALATLMFASCEKAPIGATAVEPLAGQWYVQVDGVDTVKKVVVIEDFNEGRSILLTYNNAKNDPNRLYINDLGGFWNFIVEVDCDLNSLTFSSNGEVPNESYPCNVTITNGKIIKNGTTTPSGAKADLIQFDVNFDDDDAAAIGYPGLTYGEALGFHVYRVSGWRHTGLVNDN